MKIASKTRVCAVLALSLLLLGAAAFAQTDTDDETTIRRGSLVKIGIDVVIAENELTENVIVLGGNVTVNGEVEESVIAIGGSISITGEVGGDVISIGESIIIESGASVGGDVVTSDGQIAIANVASVEGQIREKDLTGLFSQWDDVHQFGSRYVGVPSTVGFFIGLITTLLLGLLIAYLMPNLITTQAEALEREPAKVLGWGVLAMLIFVPLIIMLVFTIIGIALVPLLVLTYAFSAFLGILASSLVLGRYLAHQVKFDKPTMIVSIAMGIILLAILRLIPVIGDLLTLALWIGGWGVVILTRFGTRPVQSETAS